MNLKKRKIDFTSLFLYALSFFLLWEWLRPVQQLTDTGQFGVFLGFVTIALLLSYAKVPSFPSVLIKGLYILYMVHSVYYQGSFLQLSWFRHFWGEIRVNLGLVWNGEYLGLSNPFRTLLFFTLLWLIAYLIQYWLIKQKRIFVFFLMTILFITVLDTFSPYEADGAIIRAVSIGFLIMGLLTFQRLVEAEVIENTFTLIKKWLVPLMVMIAGSVVMGYAAPKANPIWPDPVPFIQSFNPDSDQGDIGGGRRAGYGTDDSNLGGPFFGDDSLVFRAEVDEGHYWKVETKDVYTGKGWVTVEQEPFDFNAESVPMMSFSNSVPSEEMTSTVFNVLKYPHIQYPHGLIEIETNEPYWYKMNPATQKISPLQDLESKTPDAYMVHYKKPVFQVEALQKSTPEVNDFEFEAVKTRYTQLPDHLPQSIRELALEITEDEETMFEKVQAVERYFRLNSFVYDQVNVAKPEEGEDYVEQFLFETKRGYCDNFSTSMAVLLRTLDIPTRWVKGYTDGDFIKVESGKRIYEITNNNAHSWVEVFFPEVGWVPFEPTKGFSNNVVFQSDTTTTTTRDSEEAREAIAPTPVERQMDDLANGSESSMNANSLWLKKVKITFVENWKLLITLLGLIVMIIAIIYKSRAKWLPFYYIRIYRLRKNEEHFPDAYLTLLAQLDRSGLKRKQGQTLREYAKAVDSVFVGQEMHQLTEQYERFLYRGTLKEGTWSEVKGTWETLMKKTGA